MTEDAEITVLATMFGDAGSVAEVVGYLQPEDFIDERHRLIYSSIVYLHTLGEPVSPITVKHDLLRHKKLKAAGGPAYLETILNYHADVTDILAYSRIIKKESMRRESIRIATKVQNSDDDPEKVITWAMEKYSELSTGLTASKPESISSISSGVLRDTLELCNGTRTAPGVPTGFARLDGVLLYLQPKSVYLVAARPGLGKSALVTNFAVGAAKRGKRVFFASLEMTKEQLGMRILAMESNIAYEKIKSGNLSKKDIEVLEGADLAYRNLPIFIDDASTQPVSSIRAAAFSQQMKDGLDLVIVDYAQLCASDPNDFGLLSMVSVQLKAMAKTVGVPVVAAVQVSRRVEHREGPGRLTLADIRGTGQFEQDACVVISIWMRRHKHVIEVLKNRNGGRTPEDGIEFDFDNNTTTFFERGIEVSDAE